MTYNEKKYPLNEMGDEEIFNKLYIIHVLSQYYKVESMQLDANANYSHKNYFSYFCLKKKNNTIDFVTVHSTRAHSICIIRFKCDFFFYFY